MASAFLRNPFRGTGIPGLEGMLENQSVVTDLTDAKSLFAKCPVADMTPLLRLHELADELGVGAILAKDERGRMGLGSFKALGAAHAIAKQAVCRAPAAATEEPSTVLAGTTFVCASAGNHGLSVAAGAGVFGARAVIYLAETVPDGFADLLRSKGAEVVVEGNDYEASMKAALRAAEANGWELLSDSSWAGYLMPARDVMEGYLIMADEVGQQSQVSPSHIFLQAGVGGLAAACAVAARRQWGGEPIICVVEPEYAPALKSSIEAGRPVVAPGPVSNMGRLDCKEPSLLALEALGREADFFMTVGEQDATAAVDLLTRHGVTSSPSGVAGLAGLARATTEAVDQLDLSKNSSVLIYISEGAVESSHG